MSETYTPQNLIAGDYPLVTDIVIVDAGNLAVGSVLGKITATGKYILCDSGAADGSEVAQCILAEAADATGGDVNAVIYLSGAFDENQLVFGGADTADTHRVALRGKNIYLKKAVA
jgi:hypothetical protein